MKFIVLLFLVFLTNILITGCESSEGLLDPTYFFGKFHGITYTDEYGNILEIDPNDWHYNNGLNQPFPISTVNFLPACPNPINIHTHTTLRIVIFSTCHIKIYVESENGVVKNLVNDVFEVGNHSIVYNLTDNNNIDLPPGVYRCFLESEGKKYYGDIWIKEEY